MARMFKGVDLRRFPSLEQIVSSAPDSWSDSDVPLARRGVRVSWLVDVVRDLLTDINRSRDELIASRRSSFQKLELLNVHSLVNFFVMPLTAPLRAPLWAFVPEAHRGTPNYFVSHTWNSLLLGPPRQAIGTLDAVEDLGQFAWIDFVSYNQHTIEAVPTDLEAVIGEIGKVVFAGTPVPLLGRIWCAWELLCANRTGTDFDIAVRRGYRNDKILAVNTFYRSFRGIEKATATKQEDLRIISDEVLAQFGSAEAANLHLDRALRERLSGSWYELRERDQHLGFRPWPWLFEQKEGGASTQQLIKEPDPYYGGEIRDSVIYGSQQMTFDLLIESGLVVSAADKMAHQFRTSSQNEIELADAATQGNFERVELLLKSGANPDRVIGFTSSLANAAAGGHESVVVLLLAFGADIEGGSGLSPLACAASQGQDEMVRLLIESGADLEGDAGGEGTALFQASAKGHLSTIRLLLELGADVSTTTEKRATPLLVAAAGSHVEVVQQLIGAGANLNCTDRSGDSALHHAAYNGSIAIVAALIDAGADRAIVDKYGDTAFDLGKRVGRLDNATLDLLRP